jgi:hypothetical protein
MIRMHTLLTLRAALRAPSRFRQLTCALSLLTLLAMVSCATSIEESPHDRDSPTQQERTEAPSPSVQSATQTPSIPEPTAEEVEAKAFQEALDSKNSENMVNLCVSGTNTLACRYFEQWCQKKDGYACLAMAVIAKKRAATDKLQDDLQRSYLDKACLYKNQDACELRQQVAEDDRRREEVSKVHREVRCAMTLWQVKRALGEEDTSASCNDNIHEGYRYGRRWVFFRSGGAYLIMDHADYQGACLNSLAQYRSIKGWFLCDGDNSR